MLWARIASAKHRGSIFRNTERLQTPQRTCSVWITRKSSLDSGSKLSLG
jgi:hypothetical protein